jgi:energy-coupling factor transporter ATP-binding protein EcfA2
MEIVKTVEKTLRSEGSDTFRSAKVRGHFDVPTSFENVVEISATVPDFDDDDWSVGLITGASGSGKSTIAREAYPHHYVAPFVERSGFNGAAIVDDFPAEMTPEDVVAALTAVGLSSVPAWLRPYRALSTGEQFRARIALALSESDEIVFDEFTSVVDRHVARAASHAVQKHVRRTGKKFVAVTCHRDVAAWLEADWIYDVDTGTLARGRLQRPPIELRIREGHRDDWRRFRRHHYLSADLHRAARIFLADVDLEGDTVNAGFFSLLPYMNRWHERGWLRGHRTVVLPDYQGLGIGNAMIEATADALWTRERKRFRATTGAPGIIYHRRKHPEAWKLVRAPSNTPARGRGSKKKKVAISAGRLTTSWIFIPTELRRPGGSSEEAPHSEEERARPAPYGRTR